MKRLIQKAFKLIINTISHKPFKESEYKNFDEVAETYATISQNLPKEYINLIQKTFKLKKTDHIIDLGCGSGLLTFELREIVDNVIGIDSSLSMIKIAQSFDIKNKITWMCIPVEQFNFKQETYNLIISLESFHLFSNQDQLIKKFFLGLKKGSSICIGWCQFHWEEFLKPIILKVFASYGINWEEEWGFWVCNNFPAIIKKSGLSLSEVKTESIKVLSKSNIHSIASFLSCINKALSLESQKRIKLKKDLEQNFRDSLNSEWIIGDSIYSIAFSTKTI